MGVELGPVAEGIRRGEQSAGVIFNRDRDAVPGGGIGMGFHQFEELLDASLGLRAGDILRSLGGADDELAAEPFHHGHLGLQAKGPEWIAGRANELDAAIFFEQRLEGVHSHLVDLLTVRRVRLAPEVESDATGGRHLGQHLGELHVAIEGRSQQIVQRERCRSGRRCPQGEHRGGGASGHQGEHVATTGIHGVVGDGDE